MTVRLSVKKLAVSYGRKDQKKRVLGPVSFTIGTAEILGIIGESGSGKSTIGYALMGLLQHSAHIDSFEAYLDGLALHKLSRREHRSILGKKIAFIPQEPLSALNPTLKIGRQIDLVLRRHMADEKQQRRLAICTALERLSIREPERVLRSFPHQLSGGQIQRILIAQAIALDTPLIIADEPTTALDVTVQTEVLKDLKDAVQQSGRSLLFVSHSIGVVWSLCDRTLVMRKGEIVEEGRTQQIIPGSEHPYTRELIAALPSLSKPRTLLPIAGERT